MEKICGRGRKMLSYERFKEELVGYMEQEMGDRYRVDINSIRKQNTGAQEAMAVFDKKNTKNCISPNIYLEPLYQGYTKELALPGCCCRLVFPLYPGMGGG